MTLPTLEQQTNIEEVLALAHERRVKFVNLQFVDFAGMVKNVTIPIEQLPEAIRHGKWFDGSSVEGFARIAESDMYLVPDLSTFAIIPWENGENGSARVICWVYTPSGRPFEGDPRNVLNRVLDEARHLGFSYNTGPELEFFLFKFDQSGNFSPLDRDRAGYFDSSTDPGSYVRNAMTTALRAMGIEVETSHHEIAAGQHEFDLKYSDALRTADNIITFKYTLKAMAQLQGMYATFMPKPVFGAAGSGMHVHQSLAFVDTGTNAFVDSSDSYGLSEIAKNFIAGQLFHARGMCAALAPLVNSYKRLIPEYEAPVHISWARTNRSALIRVPRIRVEKRQSTRIELRNPDPSCNPYLAFSVMLKCGLDGIKRKLPLPPSIEESLYIFDESELKRRSVGHLPLSLGEALDELERDETIQEALGIHLFQRFIEAKRAEWDAFQMHVSPWELERYFELV